MDLLASAPLVNAAGAPVAASSLKGLLVAFYFSVPHARDLAARALASFRSQNSWEGGQHGDAETPVTALYRRPTGVLRAANLRPSSRTSMRLPSPSHPIPLASENIRHFRRQNACFGKVEGLNLHTALCVAAGGE